jgi:hypothetical protein
MALFSSNRKIYEPEAVNLEVVSRDSLTLREIVHFFIENRFVSIFKFMAFCVMFPLIMGLMLMTLRLVMLDIPVSFRYFQNLLR